MKNIKTYTLIILACLMLFSTAQAQTDSRNRTKETIIQDGLAQLPSKNFKALDQVISEMAATGKEGIVMLADMMVPASKGKNATFEYAIDGIVNYVSNPKNAALKPAVLEGLKEGFSKCTDNPNKAFLITEMQKIATKADVPFFEKLLTDKYLKDYAQSAIATVKGEEKADCCNAGKTCENIAEKLKSKDAQERCCALRCLMLSNKADAEKNILKALKDPCIQYRNTALLNAEQAAGKGIYATVAAKKWSDAAQVDVVRWLGNNKRTEQVTVVLKAIQQKKNAELTKAGIEAAGKIGGKEALKALVAELGGDYAPEAKAALLAFNGKINDEVVAVLSSSNSKVQENALALVGERRMKSAYKQVMALTKNTNADVKNAACKALAGVASVENLDEICTMMENAPAAEVEAAQNAAKSAIKVLKADEQYKMVNQRMQKTSKSALYYPLLAQVANTKAIETLKAEYAKPANKDAAYKALLQVDNEEMLPVLYEMAKQNAEKKNDILSRYLTLARKTTKNAIEKYEMYRAALDLKPTSEVVKRNTLTFLSECHVLPALPTVAPYMNDADAKTAFKAASCVKTIISKTPALMGGNMAKSALEKSLEIFKAQTNNADAGYAVDEINGQLLPKFAKTGFEEAAMAQAQGKIALGNKEYENFELYFEYKTDADAVLNLRAMPQVNLGKEKVSVNASDKTVTATPCWKAIEVKCVNDRLDVVCNGETVVSNFIMKNTPATKELLVKGIIEIVAGNAKVEVRSVYINELPETPIFKLTAEEEKEGFEVLFDGRNLDKWQGNLVDYVPVDGNIYVSARYGGKGNLYTKKKYSNFIYRFEFCFDEPGVNNGIGVRTNIGTDAAYDGMEIQVLDHDDPIYKGLRPYQQHGSVYGIIVPKHIKFDKVGTWYTEEIVADGDHIKVTVNGQVLTDGNIREACQGHNVAPDGGKVNPYTVDHKNHPGLFNKEGYVSFCGHGVGVKFRNVRILDLTKKQAQTKTKSKKK